MNRQLFQYHPQIGYTFIPGLKTRVAHEGGGYLVQANQAGFRSSREFERQKPAGVFRILLFGDSFTAADGVSNSARYSDLLESHFTGIEIFNYGLSGTGTDQQYVIYRELAAEIECDLVLIAVLVENIRRVAARYRVYLDATGKRIVYAKPYFCLESDRKLVRYHEPVPKEPVPEDHLPPEELQHVDQGGNFAWFRQTVNTLGSRARDVVQRWSRYQPLPAYESAEHPDWILTKAILSQWISECSSPVIVCPLPLYQHVEETCDPTAYQARFRELGTETGAVIHDPLPDYWQVPDSTRRKFRFPSDIHPTPLSHQLLADSLKPCIQSFLHPGDDE